MQVPFQWSRPFRFNPIQSSAKNNYNTAEYVRSTEYAVGIYNNNNNNNKITIVIIIQYTGATIIQSISISSDLGWW